MNWRCWRSCMGSQFWIIVGLGVLGAVLGAVVTLGGSPMAMLIGALLGAGIFMAVALAGSALMCAARCRG